MTESKYVTNNFCFHDEFEKVKAVFKKLSPLPVQLGGKSKNKMPFISQIHHGNKSY